MYATQKRALTEARQYERAPASVGSAAIAFQQLAGQAGNQAMLAHLGQRSEPAATGESLPNAIMQRFERKSGVPLDDVRVHYNSDKPERFDAEAYARGNEIFIGPGNEQDLEHEVGHVVQQKQGLVKPTGQIHGLPINRDEHLEKCSVGHIDMLNCHNSPNPPVIQCCRGKGRQKPAFNPTHTNLYEQRRDPTLYHFFRNQTENYIGEEGMELQRMGHSAIKAEQIRVQPYNRSGLHEIIPTNMRNKLSKLVFRKLGLGGVQSGARTDTGNTVFYINGEIAGHTGTFVNAAERYTLLKNQGKAHDIVRNAVRSIRVPQQITEMEARKAWYMILASGIKSFATGRNIIDSNRFNGVFHRRTGKSLDKTTKDGRKNLIAFAQEFHERRELAKQRLCQLADYHNIPRPCSPERTEIEDDGSGGEYTTRPLRPSLPLPKFGGIELDEKAANESAYVTAPFRRFFSAFSMAQNSQNRTAQKRKIGKTSKLSPPPKRGKT